MACCSSGMVLNVNNAGTKMESFGILLKLTTNETNNLTLRRTDSTVRVQPSTPGHISRLMECKSLFYGSPCASSQEIVGPCVCALFSWDTTIKTPSTMKT
jgi:hypothetical protein